MMIPCPIHRLREPDAIAIIDGDQQLSYRDLNDMVASAAGAIQPGVRLGLCPERNVESIVALFAILRAGATACLLSSRSTQSQREELCRIVGVSSMVVQKKLSQSSPSGSAELAIDADATIMFSSGSTGAPKAALHTVGNHYYSALGANANMPLIPGDRWLLSLPLYHVGGLAILWRCFLAGAAVVIDRGARFTHISIVPTQLRDMLNDPPDGLKAVLLGGAVLPPALCRQAIEAGLPLYTTYGCTEMASQVTTGNSPEDSGCLLEHRELKIADDGEILLRGRTLFKGYVTIDAVDPARDEDGWYHSGDLGEYCEGRLRIIGRKDNMFISGGENIHPEEIERRLLEVDGLNEAIVVSVPNDRYGRRPVAFAAGSWTEEDLRRHLVLHLPKFMIPDVFLPLPQTGELKPSRPELERTACRRLESTATKKPDLL